MGERPKEKRMRAMEGTLWEGERGRACACMIEKLALASYKEKRIVKVLKTNIDHNLI